MVQISLKKYLVLVVVTVIVSLLLVWFRDDDGHSSHCREHGNSGRMLLNGVSSHPIVPLQDVVLDPARRMELKRVYADIVQAYSNGQVRTLQEWRRILPSQVEKIRESDLIDVERQFLGVVHDELLIKVNKILAGRPIEEDYGSATAFETHLLSFWAFTCLYGDIQLRRRGFGTLFSDLEALVLYRLKAYRDHYHAIGKNDLENTADRFLSQWTAQIESENGYTRNLLVSRIENDRKWADSIQRETGQSWEEIVQSAIGQTVHMLRRVGYDPKWVQEFKNVPR